MKLKKIFLPSKSERGQSLTELAVIVVIMIIILAGVVDAGGVIFQYLAMRDAAQEGASYATAFHSCNEIVDRVYASLYNADPNVVLVNVLIDGEQCVEASASNACAGNEWR